MYYNEATGGRYVNVEQFISLVMALGLLLLALWALKGVRSYCRCIRGLGHVLVSSIHPLVFLRMVSAVASAVGGAASWPIKCNEQAAVPVAVSGGGKRIQSVIKRGALLSLLGLCLRPARLAGRKQ